MKYVWVWMNTWDEEEKKKWIRELTFYFLKQEAVRDFTKTRLQGKKKWIRELTFSFFKTRSSTWLQQNATRSRVLLTRVFFVEDAECNTRVWNTRLKVAYFWYLHILLCRCRIELNTQLGKRDLRVAYSSRIFNFYSFSAEITNFSKIWLLPQMLKIHPRLFSCQNYQCTHM